MAGADRRCKLGLSLAGGGFRASLFHLGVLHRMADLDLLRHVELLSTVSGGSIIGALYILLLRNRLRTSPNLEQAEYVALVDEVHRILVTAIQRNLRMRLFMNPLRLLWIMMSHDTLGRAMGRLYERHIYRFALIGPEANKRGRIALRSLLTKPGGQRLLGGIEQYNCQACAAGRSAVTSLVLNATSLNSGAAFRFSAVEIGDSRVGSFRNDEIETEILPRKTLLEDAALPELLRVLDSSVEGDLCMIGGAPYNREVVLYAAWWRTSQEAKPPPRSASRLFGSAEIPASLRDADFGCLRQAKLSAWYLQRGPKQNPPVRSALTDDVLKARFWDALHMADDARASTLEQQAAQDPAFFPSLLEGVLHLFYLRAATVVSDNIKSDWEALTLGDAVGASACFPPVFPPFILHGIYDDLRLTRLGLTDGGVYDNLGVTALLEQGCTHIIASDTGGLFDIMQRSSRGRLGMGGRIISVLMDDIAEQQRDALRTQRRFSEGIPNTGIPPALQTLKEMMGLDGLAYFHINSPRPDIPGIDLKVDSRTLADLRTDLDAFADVEIAALVNHGYAMADRYIRQFLHDSPYADETKCSLPTEPPMPFVLDPNASRVLRAGKSRVLRGLFVHAPVSIATVAVVVSVLGYKTWRISGTELAERIADLVERLSAATAAGGVALWLPRIHVGRLIIAAVLLGVGVSVLKRTVRNQRWVRRVLTATKWIRSLAMNVLWLFAAAPLWISGLVSVIACLLHWLDTMPFLRKGRLPGGAGSIRK